MIDHLICDRLYMELLITAVLLLLIMLLNNLVLYRQRIREPVSLMLLFAAALSFFEILWLTFDGLGEFRAVTYIGGTGYVVSFIVFAAILNHFFLSRFGYAPKQKRPTLLLYDLPPFVFLVLCATTPWTRLVFWLDENHVLCEGILFQTIVPAIVYGYVLSAVFLGIVYIIRHRNQAKAELWDAWGLIIFAVMLLVFYLLQYFILQDMDSDYIATSLAVSISLVFLVINVSTRSLLASEEKIYAVQNELGIAAKIQLDALPLVESASGGHEENRETAAREVFPVDDSKFELAASMTPATYVGGDFYDFFYVDDDHLALVVADVSGKGMPAALFMMQSKALIKAYASPGKSPAKVLSEVNNELLKYNNAERLFVTVDLFVIELTTGKALEANAGHEYPAFRRAGGGYELIEKEHSLVLGVMRDIPICDNQWQFSHGDSLFLYTDGVDEAKNKEGEFFGDERMLLALNEAGDRNMEDTLAHIKNCITGFVGDTQQYDDITMLGFRFR